MKKLKRSMRRHRKKNEIPTGEPLIDLGDFNAKIGNTSHETIKRVGNFRLEEKNDRENWLFRSAIDSDLTIAISTLFKHHPAVNLNKREVQESGRLYFNQEQMRRN